MLAVPASERECAGMNSKEVVQQEARQYASGFPGADLIEDADVMPSAKINGYTISIPLGDRTVVQHKYFYCRGRKAVVITSASSSVEDEAEIGRIVSTISVADL